MPKPKPQRICKQCSQEFQAWSSHRQMIRLCSPGCAYQFAQDKRKRDARKRTRAEARAYRQANESIGSLTAKAQAAFNWYIRERDAGPCMACGTTKQNDGITGSSWDAGHYRSRGSAPGMRFHLLNVWKVCTRCNRELSGNVVEMRKGLVGRLGEERVCGLERDNRSPQYRREDLKRMARIFNRRARLYRRLKEQRA